MENVVKVVRNSEKIYKGDPWEWSSGMYMCDDNSSSLFVVSSTYGKQVICISSDGEMYSPSHTKLDYWRKVLSGPIKVNSMEVK